MVSTNHKNAEYYFDRDVSGVIDFFKRKFEFTSVEAPPKFSDIERRHDMDVELAASGYSKQIQKEIEEFDEFTPKRDGDLDDDDDEENDEEGEEKEEGEEEVSQKTTQKTTSRFDEWLGTTGQNGTEVEKVEER